MIEPKELDKLFHWDVEDMYDKYVKFYNVDPIKATADFYSLLDGYDQLIDRNKKGIEETKEIIVNVLQRLTDDVVYADEDGIYTHQQSIGIKMHEYENFFNKIELVAKYLIMGGNSYLQEEYNNLYKLIIRITQCIYVEIDDFVDIMINYSATIAQAQHHMQLLENFVSHAAKTNYSSLESYKKLSKREQIKVQGYAQGGNDTVSFFVKYVKSYRYKDTAIQFLRIADDILNSSNQVTNSSIIEQVSEYIDEEKLPSTKTRNTWINDWRAFKNSP